MPNKFRSYAVKRLSVKNLFGHDVTNGANSNHPMQLYFFKKAVAVVFRFAKTR